MYYLQENKLLQQTTTYRHIPLQPKTTHAAKDLSNAFDYNSDDNTAEPPPQGSYTETYATEHAQLPPLPPLPPTPPPQPKDPPSVLNNANINTANININLSTNHHVNTSNNNTSHLSSKKPNTTNIDHNNTTKMHTTTIVNPYAKPNKNTTNPQVTPIKLNTKNNNTNNTTTTIHQTNEPPIPSSQSTNDTDENENQALEELRKMLDDHVNNTNNNEHTPSTQTSRSSLMQDNPHSNRDITLETFYQYPPAAELTTKVTEELTKILPKLTHNFNSKRKSIECEEEAANAALAWYHRIKTKTATEAVATAIDQQPIATPQTIQELIDDSITKSISKTSNQIVKTVEKQIRKKSSGLTHDQGRKAKHTYTGPDSNDTTNKTSMTPSTPNSETTTSTQPHSQALLTTTQPKPSNLITWDDYLNNKRRKTQKMKWRNQSNNHNRNARNAKWKKLP